MIRFGWFAFVFAALLQSMATVSGLLGLALVAFWPTDAAAHTCDAPFKTDLLAGSTNNIGVVEVCNDDTNLTVTYKADAPWCLTKTELDVADDLAGIPQNPHGKPITGRFAYKSNQQPCKQNFGVSIALGDWGPGTELIVAAHATASENAGKGRKSDAWGSGTAFPGGDGATYFTYTVQQSSCNRSGGSCTVFVTSRTFSGNLVGEAETLTGETPDDGLDAGDLICQFHAKEAGLVGTYKAWLSLLPDGPSPSTRFTHATVPYVMTNGAQIAADWDNLVDGGLDAPFRFNENGEQEGAFATPVTSPEVWTATLPSGQPGCALPRELHKLDVHGRQRHRRQRGLGGLHSGQRTTGFGRRAAPRNEPFKPRIYCLQQ